MVGPVSRRWPRSAVTSRRWSSRPRPVRSGPLGGAGRLSSLRRLIRTPWSLLREVRLGRVRGRLRRASWGRLCCRPGSRLCLPEFWCLRFLPWWRRFRSWSRWWSVREDARLRLREWSWVSVADTGCGPFRGGSAADSPLGKGWDHCSGRRRRKPRAVGWAVSGGAAAGLPPETGLSTRWPPRPGWLPAGGRCRPSAASAPRSARPRCGRGPGVPRPPPVARRPGGPGPAGRLLRSAC
ncbi:hypothetical protein SAMN05421507_104291 [Lentzea jiangxiensis]|uniref:Uncharacterized protein n=1 Tax=Lentzea jiangxiensis TaxID=641025 RepID=A0A1H0N791_9PSEU|nr:hypothetical protein SAMN05421507_104291 [Lentzea jiangxiensis]